MSEKKLVKSRNRMIAGVCGGLAEYLGLDPTIMRLIYVILTIFTAFAGAIVYIILWVLMPGNQRG